VTCPSHGRTVLVTGGAGFIGSTLCRHLIRGGNTRVVNLDALTYAGSAAAVGRVQESPDYRFVRGNIADAKLVSELLNEEQVDAIMHLAAESHVDRSLAKPAKFIETNILGTFTLLESSLEYWRSLPEERAASFRFHHISTDEVFGDLAFDRGIFTEESPYRPSSPYSASKASADHLVRAWHHSFGLPILISNCSNNYGPYQHAEKLIPKTISRAIACLPIPVYGTGANVRDWLHVDDHVNALETVMLAGVPGQTYLIGAQAERTNLSVVQHICDLVDARLPIEGVSRRSLIRFVADRPGHDQRYAIAPTRIEAELGWRATIPFADGLAATVDWYIAASAATW